MTDLKFLGVEPHSDKEKIQQTLKEKISDLDFEIDIERIFAYIHCAQRLIQQIEKTSADILKKETEKLAPDVTESIETPEALIAQFVKLYENPSTRFKKTFWQTILNSLSKTDKNSLQAYCKPVADFLNTHPFLKSDVLILIANFFPFNTFFPNPKESNESDHAFWQEYGYIHSLLRRGNLEFDLYAETLNTGQFSNSQLEDLYNRLMTSTRFYRTRQFAQAFNVLSNGIPAHVKPLLFWQRELNILYKANFVEKEENLTEVFENTLNQALSSFPDDEQLIYLRSKFLFHQYSPEEFKDDIIATLRMIPDQPKCWFLLGKCYQQLGISRAALIIFENLQKITPLNMEYITAAASASRAYFDFCLNELDPKDQNKAYYIRIISSLVERNMFEEVAVFAKDAPQNDPDIKALLLYAKDLENFSIGGKKDKEILFDALLLAKDTEIRRKIKIHYLKDLPTWGDVKEERNFILNFYSEYPTDAMANYQMGMAHYADGENEKAYLYFLKAKEIAPDNEQFYYNLARATADTKRYAEAVEFIKTYLLYNKYNLSANQLHCEWAFQLNDHKSAHLSAKWILSICRTDEFRSEPFYYLVACLSNYLDTIDVKFHNHEYIRETLELFDRYTKPSTFWTDDLGPKAIYFAAKLSYNIGDFKNCIKYVNTLLQNSPKQDVDYVRICLLEFLPKSLYALEKYDELIQQFETPVQQLLNNNLHPGRTSLAAIYISHSHGALLNFPKQIEWAINGAKAYMQTDVPPIDWLKDFLAEKFGVCLKNNLKEFIIPIGDFYLKNISPIHANHVWIAHHLGNTYEAIENREEALKHHKLCLDLGLSFPEICTVEKTNSQKYINA